MVLTEKGFKRPTYEELLARQINRARALFGEGIDTSETSVLGKYIRIDVQDLNECYELLEEIYYARFTNSARGQSLDRLCTFAAITRDPATYPRLRTRFFGTSGSVIPAAFLISGNGLTFYTDCESIVGQEGSAEVFVNCTVAGTAGNLPVGTELSIVNPSPYLERVEYIGMKQYGRERESDTALRRRFDESVSGSGSATQTAIRGAIARVPLVRGVTIIENDTDETVGDLPPNSFKCYVLAPESQDPLVAAAIFSKKPLGIKCFGDVEVPIQDENGKSHIIRFSRTAEKGVSIKGRVLVNQYFETEGINQIKERLLEAVNHLTNGETVYLSSLYASMHQVSGVVNVPELLISGDGSTFEGKDIPVGEYEIARISAEQIEIEVVT